MSPFLVLGLPRSRTYWMSGFLSYGDWVCGHEEARYLRTLADIKSWLSQDMVGSVETAIAPYWRLIKKFRPDTRIIVIRRPVSEAVDSFIAASGIDDRERLTATFTQIDRKLDQIEKRVPGVLSFRFDDLANEGVCARLFEYCLGYKHDHAWWKSWDRTRVQMNLRALMRYCSAFHSQLRTISSIAAQESKKLMWVGRKPHDKDGMKFEEISFDQFYSEAQKLISQHEADAGEPSDHFITKNLPLIARLSAANSLQIVVAKCNGRMFGYLISVLGESLEDAGLTVAAQTMFYRTPDAPGLGTRLQQASIDFLEKRGGRWEVVQRAGRRASGPTLGKLYTRMGAEDHGQLYRILVGSD